MNEGLMIVLEGVDGCGKDTQIDLLVERLRRQYSSREIVSTCEPWDSEHCPLGSRIRRVLCKEEREIDPGDNEVDPQKFQTMYVEARYIHWAKLVLPALKTGAIVVSNRERLSTFVYGALQGVPMVRIASWHELLSDPDLTILIDISAQTSLERLSKRSGEQEHFEKEEWLGRLVAIYQTAVESEGWPGDLMIDGERSVEEVHEDIFVACKKLIERS